MNKLIDMLEDNEDVQNVWHNWQQEKERVLQENGPYMKKQAALNFSLVPPAFVHFTFCVFHTGKG